MRDKKKLACSLAILFIVNILVFIAATSAPVRRATFQDSIRNIVQEIISPAFGGGYQSDDKPRFVIGTGANSRLHEATRENGFGK